MNSTETASTTSVDDLLDAAARAHSSWAHTPAEQRADALDAVGRALEGAADELVPLGMEETHLPEGRLRGELKRTAFQLGLFAEVLRDGEFLDARIDHADAEWPMGAARPDLRRSMRPIGPVLVFAASNFPFAFSVAGGDTASALAAGNAVVVKAHEGHPRLSEAVASTVREALAQSGVDKDLLTLVTDRDEAVAILRDPRIKAAGFTGSIPGGRALFDIACSRPDPIPFYGELGSTNPVFVTRAAADARGADIVKGFLESFTMGTGQFCTKPGVLFVPAAAGLVEKLGQGPLPEVGAMLTPGIEAGFDKVLKGLRQAPEVSVLAQGDRGTGPAPSLLRTTVDALLSAPEDLEVECFGPAALVVEYEDEQQLVQAARTFHGQLTATLQAEEGDDVADLVDVLAEKAGRVLWNQWPTGVSVTYAQQHGGPYPATTAPGTTSVGTAAIERFQRPVAFQNFPQALLPQELRDDATGMPRLVDGQRTH